MQTTAGTWSLQIDTTASAAVTTAAAILEEIRVPDPILIEGRVAPIHPPATPDEQRHAKGGQSQQPGQISKHIKHTPLRTAATGSLQPAAPGWRR